MINTIVKDENISSEELSTMMNKADFFIIDRCEISGNGYISNLNSKILITNSRLKDVTVVLRDSLENKLEYNIIDSGVIKGVSLVQGYAYTQQVICTSQNGLPTRDNNFNINV